MALSFIPNNAFALPAPLTPTLVSLGMDNQTASTASNIYHAAALALKEACGREYTHACSAIIATSDNRGHSSKELRSKLLTVAIARYTQAVSKWREETIDKAKASLLRRNKKNVPQSKAKHTTAPLPNCPRSWVKPSEKTHFPKNSPFSVDSPPHAFPHAYPPPVRPEPISFVTHMPAVGRGSRRAQRSVSTNDLDACIEALSRLSLGPPSPQASSPKPSKSQKPRSRSHSTSKSKSTFQPSPSRPRLVSPVLDASFALFHRLPPRNVTPCPPPAAMPPSQSIDIPRSNRRKACSIPYRRPAAHLSTSPESPEHSYSRSIRRTPSLVSDYDSEASSPSTPPDFPSVPIPTPIIARKGSFPESISLLERLLVPHSEPGWQNIDFGTDIYG